MFASLAHSLKMTILNFVYLVTYGIDIILIVTRNNDSSAFVLQMD